MLGWEELGSEIAEQGVSTAEPRHCCQWGEVWAPGGKYLVKTSCTQEASSFSWNAGWWRTAGSLTLCFPLLLALRMVPVSFCCFYIFIICFLLFFLSHKYLHCILIPSRAIVSELVFLFLSNIELHMTKKLCIFKVFNLLFWYTYIYCEISSGSICCKACMREGEHFASYGVVPASCSRSLYTFSLWKVHI